MPLWNRYHKVSPDRSHYRGRADSGMQSVSTAAPARGGASVCFKLGRRLLVTRAVILRFAAAQLETQRCPRGKRSGNDALGAERRPGSGACTGAVEPTRRYLEGRSAFSARSARNRARAGAMPPHARPGWVDRGRLDNGSPEHREGIRKSEQRWPWPPPRRLSESGGGPPGPARERPHGPAPEWARPNWYAPNRDNPQNGRRPVEGARSRERAHGKPGFLTGLAENGSR